jgi:hypothetical protein
MVKKILAESLKLMTDIVNPKSPIFGFTINNISLKGRVKKPCLFYCRSKDGTGRYLHAIFP